MILHIVLFRPMDGMPQERRQEVLTAVTTAVNRCPTVRTARVGRRIRHGLPGYEQMMVEDYEYLLVLEFADITGLQAYLAHPEHARIGSFFTSAAAASLAYDYEVVELADASRLL